MVDPYNPLDKLNLGRSVVEAMLIQIACPLSAVTPFAGAGIYAIYYHGPFEPYTMISGDSQGIHAKPIYVGKAVPSGSRKGSSLAASVSGRWLYGRIVEHRDSIAAVERHGSNLRVSDFSVRYLAVDDIWIPLGEALLISSFNPLWNVVIEGFGNHDPGAGRYNGMRPLWDVLHPGRAWAERCQPRTETREELGRRIIDYLSQQQ